MEIDFSKIQTLNSKYNDTSVKTNGKHKAHTFSGTVVKGKNIGYFSSTWTKSSFNKPL